MGDEYTNITNKEQFSFCIRAVDDNLEVKEDFLGFYELENIKSVTVVNAIKDILLRFHLSFQYCRGQTYDAVSNMMGKKFGVATKLLVEQPKAFVTHRQGQSLSLTVKDLSACCKILCDIMNTVKKICVLVKYSPKRESILGTMYEKFERNFDPNTDKFSALEKLCPTRGLYVLLVFRRSSTTTVCY